MTPRLHRRGTTGSAPQTVDIGPGAGWQHTGLEVFELESGIDVRRELTDREAMVVPLAGGGLTAEIDGDTFHLVGRETPWGVTDVLYVPLGSSLRLTSSLPVRVALPWAPAERTFPVQLIARDAVAVELRGAGICSRQVNNIGTPDALEADRLIVCEVMQPGGNWSSYPPHKHDVDGDTENVLEEIYYYEVDASPAGTEGFALQRVYGSEAGEADVTEEVRTGDAVTIPYGYHGPTVAAPGHRLYYLNVMAGPATPRHPDRAWLISDDPYHAWIRESWKTEEHDPRLPWR